MWDYGRQLEMDGRLKVKLTSRSVSGTWRSPIFFSFDDILLHVGAKNNVVSVNCFYSLGHRVAKAFPSWYNLELLSIRS